ncbi:ScbR family autoregulator-binding transcription factor [Streptomyces sp. AP-93]|uniref:ScbR family autoregulator-binding transcription factor n=1 Tax=Streptomyces sp. AP-93 TaxID=2929048 RepID=UPI001FAEA8AC|nr:ScbR family autoregulator-binding transcription factor [Streptomyces sp. AP-93]MCJ0871903.1 TetR/AcrR family transcriptional regulator [Streptomyces sp. AP-93]
MAKQERATRTREALVRAAASAFDRAGYEATTLARIIQSAGLSMGALTFHFRSKEELADAVHAQGECAVRAAVERAAASGEPPLRAAVCLTLEIARLLEEDTAVRAAARLARERADGSDSWSSLWLPLVERLLARATETEGELRPGSDPGAVLTLVAYLVAGAEADSRVRATTPGEQGDCAERRLGRIWDAVLPGISGTDRPAP